eukprot:s85_g15.t1
MWCPKLHLQPSDFSHRASGVFGLHFLIDFLSPATPVQGWADNQFGTQVVHGIPAGEQAAKQLQMEQERPGDKNTNEGNSHAHSCT